MGASDDVITIQASDLEFANATFTNKKYKNNPKGQLVRHEFMEFMTRIANKKYDYLKLTVDEAVEKFWDDHLVTSAMKFDQ